MKQKCGSGHIKVQGHAFRFYSWPSMLHWKAMHNSMHGLQEPFWVKQKSKKLTKKGHACLGLVKAENPQLYEFCNVYTPPAFHLDNQRGARTVILGPFPNNIINWNKMICIQFRKVYAIILAMIWENLGFAESTSNLVSFLQEYHLAVLAQW